MTALLEIALRRPRGASEYVETLHSCLEEVERLAVLVDELLALARLDAGQNRGGAEPIALDRLVEETAQRFAEVARERDVRIDVEPATSIVAAIGRGPASMILATLLDNAIKFSPPGGTICVSARVAGEETLLTVTDQGPGIRSDELPHVFERFYRGQAARAGTAPGVGLGLALSQAIARAYGGRIDASPAVERGTAFTVRFRCFRRVLPRPPYPTRCPRPRRHLHRRGRYWISCAARPGTAGCAAAPPTPATPARRPGRFR